MNFRVQPMSEVSSRAKTALMRELGAVDTMRYLSQFTAGAGNYTAERGALFKDESVKSIVSAIKAKRG
jgi:hypothetical protein